MRRFRQVLGFYLFVSMAVSLPKSIYLYKNLEMIDRKLWLYSPWIFPDFIFSSSFFIYALLTSLMIFSFRLFIEKNSYLDIVFLAIGHLFIQYSNPLVIHEPQPLTQLFLWSLVLSGPNNKGDSFLKSNLIWLLGIYYLLAGLEKLPDPQWIHGQALAHILSNPLMALHSANNQSIITSASPLLWLATYMVLFFEMSFIIGIKTRFKAAYVFFGLIMHLLISFTLDVGTLSFLMICWYSIFMDDREKNYVLDFQFIKKR